jgi:hypothetical protein
MTTPQPQDPKQLLLTYLASITRLVEQADHVIKWSSSAPIGIDETTRDGYWVRTPNGHRRIRLDAELFTEPAKTVEDVDTAEFTSGHKVTRTPTGEADSGWVRYKYKIYNASGSVLTEWHCTEWEADGPPNALVDL